MTIEQRFLYYEASTGYAYKNLDHAKEALVLPVEQRKDRQMGGWGQYRSARSRITGQPTMEHQQATAAGSMTPTESCGSRRSATSHSSVSHTAVSLTGLLIMVALTLGMMGSYLTPGSVQAEAHSALAVRASSAAPRSNHSSALSRSKAATIFTAGSDITVSVIGVSPPAAGLCVGLASLIDRGGIPMTLGKLRPSQGVPGLLTLQATIPQRVIPAEPAGPFLVYVGECSPMAPIGRMAETKITLLPAHPPVG